MKILFLKPQLENDKLIFVEEKNSEERKFSEIDKINEKLIDFNLQRFINKQSLNKAGMSEDFKFS